MTSNWGSSTTRTLKSVLEPTEVNGILRNIPIKSDEVPSATPIFLVVYSQDKPRTSPNERDVWFGTSPDSNSTAKETICSAVVGECLCVAVTD